MTLSIDIETYSSKNLKKTGMYPYVHAPDFQVLMIGYAYDDEPVQIIDLTEYAFPAWLRADILNPSIRKTAYNAPFEIAGLSQELGVELNPADWDCTQVQGARAGYPMGLDAIASALQVPGKFESGTALINYFTTPCKPTKSNGYRTRNYAHHDPEKWAEFMAYCANDVQVERDVRNRVKDFPVIKEEHLLWQLDQRINARGVLVDIPYVTKVLEIAEWYTALIRGEAIELTGVQNPGSVKQLVEWLNENLDEDEEEVTKLTKATVEEMLSYMPDGKVRRLLELRQEMSKSSLRKYDAMVNMAGYDNRIRGLFQFYGASRTGRWAGRGVQLQNLPRNYIELLELARQLAEAGDGEGIDIMFGNVPDVLSQLVRTALIPKVGHRFLVSDFSAIEARVIAWLAGEQWKLDVFTTHGKIYEATASRMFGVPLESIKKGLANYRLRSSGKVAELACIAKDQLVLTDKGLVKIQNINKYHKVWDGLHWVTQGGCIFKGFKRVITYEGLTATEDHLVWVEGQKEPVQFGVAASCGSRLLQTGHGRRSLRMGKDYKPGKKMESKLAAPFGTNAVYRMRKSAMDKFTFFANRKVKGLSVVFTTAANTEMVGSKANSREATMHKSKRCELPQLRGKRDRISLRFDIGSRFISFRNRRFTKTCARIRSGRQQRSLRAREHSFYYAKKANGESANYCYSRMETRRLALHGYCRYPQAISRFITCGNFRRGEARGVTQAKKLESYSSEIETFDLLNCGPDNRFTVSNVLVHNCGYGGTTQALINMGALREGLTEDDLWPIVNAWRRTNPKIVKLWDTVEKAARLAIMSPGKRVTIQKGVSFRMHGNDLWIQLPSGRILAYVDCKIVAGARGRSRITYRKADKKQWWWTDTYGGKLVENCLAGDTEVLTNLGWVRITDVSRDMLLWDGVDWVKHEGLIEKGVRNTICIDGVRLTEDHLILTHKGWKNASQSEGLNRHEDSFLNSASIRRFNRFEVNLVDKMRLRKRVRTGSYGVFERAPVQLRMPKGRTYRRKGCNTWKFETQNVSRLEVHESSLQQPENKSLERLWRSRDISLRKLDGRFQEFLGRHARGLRRRVNAGKGGCKQRILQGKLYVGELYATSSKPPEKHFYRNSLGPNNSCGSRYSFRAKRNNVTLSSGKQLPDRPFVRGSGRYEPVYDLVNAGPRHRFMVKGPNSSPFIVHNCVQAIARDCLAVALMRLDRAGFNIVMHVHDEAVAEEKYGQRTLQEMNEIMGQVIPWARDLPLKAEGFETTFYKKD